VKTVTVRLPESLAAQIDQESKRRGLSRSDVVRERLESAVRRSHESAFDSIADLVGSVDGLPEDLSGRRKAYLTATRYGRKRSR
jgi:hypothetical protein